MQILKLKDGSGDEYLLIPWRLVKWLIGCVVIVTFSVLTYLLYFYAYLPAYAPYYVAERSSILHNRSCAYFGKAKGFYTFRPKDQRDCKVCGGREQIYNHPSDYKK